MKLFRKLTLSLVVALSCLIACQNETVSPQADVGSISAAAEFIPAELAKVEIMKDYTVIFHEVAPGFIVVSQERSLEADKKISPEIKEILRGENFVAMYQKITTGAAQDPKVLEKLQAAHQQRGVANGKIVPQNRSIQSPSISEGANAGRLAGDDIPHCQNNTQGGDEYFYQTYRKIPPGPTAYPILYRRNSRAYSTTLNKGVYYFVSITVLNNQAWGSVNTIGVTLPGYSSNQNLVGAQLKSWSMDVQSGTLAWAFTNGLNCATTQCVVWGHTVSGD